jgi:hypothetical protein
VDASKDVLILTSSHLDLRLFLHSRKLWLSNWGSVIPDCVKFQRDWNDVVSVRIAYLFRCFF